MIKDNVIYFSIFQITKSDNFHVDYIFFYLSTINGDAIDLFVRRSRLNRFIKVDEEKKIFIEVEPLFFPKIKKFAIKSESTKCKLIELITNEKSSY